MSYLRVIPGDLDREAKLLKGLAWLAGHIGEDRFRNVTQELRDSHLGFVIDRSEERGVIYCTNYHVYVGKHELELFVPVNNVLDHHPLHFMKAGRVLRVFEYCVHTRFTAQFKEYILELEASGAFEYQKLN